MRIKFWGVRGSIPAPLSPDAFEDKIVNVLVQANGSDISTPEAAREFLRRLPFTQRRTVGGNTPCVEVEAAGEILVIDAGPGIRELGGSLMSRSIGPENQHPPESHALGPHHRAPIFRPGIRPRKQDHFLGLPFQPARTNPAPSSRRQLSGAMAADFQFEELTPCESAQIGPFDIEPCKLVHPGDSYAYSVEHDGARLVYASDASYGDLPPEELARYHEFYWGADVLVFDAHFALMDSFEKSDSGHSSSFIGVDMAVISQVKKLVLFHHDHLSSEDRLGEFFESTKKYLAHVAPDMDCEVILGNDGLELTI